MQDDTQTSSQAAPKPTSKQSVKKSAAAKLSFADSEILDVLPGVRQSSFVMKLYQLLEQHQHPRAIKWDTNGTSFTIGDRDEFADVVLKNCFGGVKLNSFLRQLNMYSFTRDMYGFTYSHPYFIKSNPLLLKLIRRRQLPTTSRVRPRPLNEVANEEPREKVACTKRSTKKIPVKEKDIKKEVTELQQHDPTIMLPTLRPVVSPHSSQPRATHYPEGICRRCAQMEHLFSQEDPFKSVFEEETNADPEHCETILTSEVKDCCSPQTTFSSSQLASILAPGGDNFSAFKADSKYFNPMDLYVDSPRLL